MEQLPKKNFGEAEKGYFKSYEMGEGTKEKLKEKIIVELGCGTPTEGTPLPLRVGLYETQKKRGWMGGLSDKEYAILKPIFEELKEGRAKYIGVDNYSGIRHVRESIEEMVEENEIKILADKDIVGHRYIYSEYLPKDWRERLSFIRGDAENIPLKDQTVDTVFIRELQFGLDESGAKDIYRILKKEGQFLLHFFSGSYRPDFEDSQFKFLCSIFKFEGPLLTYTDGKKRNVYNYFSFRKQ